MPEPAARLRAVAIVGDDLRHRWFAERIAADTRLELRGIASERQRPPVRGRSEDEDALVADHFARRSRAEERFFGAARPLEGIGVPLLEVPTGESNRPDVAEWIQRLEPDWLLLYGCGIIRAPLLDRFEGRTVNMHLGLSPYYRGHATNFWPLVNGEPECVGVTMHLATPDVDAGPILRQLRPPMSPDDDSHEIGCRAIESGTEAVIDALVAYRDGAEPVRQRSDGRVYTHADFDGGAVAEMRRRFAEGMIQHYLEEKPERDARFPIVG